jgi:two-component system chemotaxis response regulator CheB
MVYTKINSKEFLIFENMVSNNSEATNIITIGASAGGLEAVTCLVNTFPSDLDAAIFIVIHLSTASRSDVIIKIIKQSTTLKCTVPADQQRIENRTIYLAPADHHLAVEKGFIRISRGAPENQYRPSIDLLFRSAATAYTGCVTGIILTGLLDDGTSGMSAIKRCGGKCIVQSPKEAAFPDMPNSVLRHVEVDYSVPVSEMGAILSKLYSIAACEELEVPADIKIESEIARRVSTNMADVAKLGSFTPFTCPSCGGVMVRVENDPLVRYRCYTGHSFTLKFIESEQLKRIEESLWVSIRMMEERKNLLLNILADTNLQDTSGLRRTDERIYHMQQHIDILRSALLTIDSGPT